MAALNTDLFKKLSRRWVGQIGSGGVADDTTATIPLASTTNLATDTAVVAVIDRVDANGTPTPTLEETIIGVVSGDNLATSVRGVEGTAQAHSAGAVVEILVTAKGWNDLIDGLLLQHNQLGGHTNITASNINASGVFTMNGVAFSSTPPTASQVLTAQSSTVASWVTPASSVSATDGWTADSDTWTYASASTFTVTGDVTTRFTKGTKLKFTQTTAKYAVVRSSSHSGGTTTVTIAVNTDYTLANAAITSPYYSYEACPAGYPTWFAFTTTLGGFSANPSNTTLYYAIEGTAISFYYEGGGSNGTSNATSLTFTLPVLVKRSLSAPGMVFAIDNTAIVTAPGHLVTTANSATINAFKGFSQTAWTSSGGKNIYIPVTTLEWV